MSSFVDDGWGDDGDLDVSATSLGDDDGWGEDDDFFGDDDGGGEKENDGIGFPSVAPMIVQSNQTTNVPQSGDDEEDLKLDDGWGEDDDVFGDDSGDENDNDGIAFPPAAPVGAQSNQTLKLPQSNNDEEDLKFDDGWGEDDDFFDDESGDDEKQDEGVGFPPAAPAITRSNPMSEISRTNNSQQKLESVSKNAGGGSTSFGLPEKAGQGYNIPTQQSRQVPAPNDFHREENPMVTELSKYIQSLDRMLSSINTVLEFEYNTYQKAKELLEYYDNRPQLAEYTRAKELQRMNYEIVLPDGYVETNKERIIGENMLPDNAIVSRAANQSLLADILQVITGHDLIVRPQYLASCIATSCKFVIHKGDMGADMIDCRSLLSLFLPTSTGERLNIAEVTVSVVFAPSQPMIEFRVVKIEVLLKDSSKLSGVADFLREMDIPVEDHEIIDAPPDMYRDAFLEKSQRFFALSSEGMKSAFQQMDSVINLKGKMKSISSFIPDTDQVLAAEQEAIAFAEARRIELKQQQQQREHAFPRPPPQHQPSGQQNEHAFPRPPPPHHPSEQQREHSFPRPPPPRPPSQDQVHNETKRPKSILGGLVRSGWKTLANSVAIPDDNPDIYGEFVPSQPHRAPEQQMKFYRKEEPAPAIGSSLYRNNGAQPRPQPQPPRAPDQRMKLYRKEENLPAEGPTLYRNDNSRIVSKSNQEVKSQMYMQRQGASNIDIGSENDTTDQDPFGSHGANHQSQLTVDRHAPEVGTACNSQNDPHGPSSTDHQRNDIQRNENQTEKKIEPTELPDTSRESGEVKNQEVSEEAAENDFEDGWDDGLDGFDDISDNLEEFPEHHESLAEPDQERDNTSSDIVLVDSFVPTDKHGGMDGACDTRRRWVNPRPHRPYLKYLLP